MLLNECLCPIKIHKFFGVPVMAQCLTNPTRNHEVVGSIPGLVQWVNDPALLWLWCRPAAAAPIRPLAWEPPYAVGVALEKPKKDHKKLTVIHKVNYFTNLTAFFFLAF